MEQNLVEYLNDLLNSLLSINYMTLKQRQKAMPNDGQMFFSSSDVFGKKSFSEEYEMGLFNEVIKFRNETIEEIKESLKNQNLPGYFDLNSHNLVDFFNEHSSKKINYDDYFKGGRTSYEKLDHLADEINNGVFDSTASKIVIIDAFNAFRVFFEQQRLFNIYVDLIEAAENEISMYGFKTSEYKKPENPNIFVFDKEKVTTFLEDILYTIEQNHKDFFKLSARKQKAAIEENEELQTLAERIMYLDSISDMYFDRVTASNTSYSKLEPKPILLKLFKKVFLKTEEEQELAINEVYIHREEIKNLIDAIEELPEVAHQKSILEELYLNKNFQAKTLS